MTYKRGNCILTVDDFDIAIGYNDSELEIVDIPVKLAKIKEVRDAIFDAYINFGDIDSNLIYRILRESAPINVLNQVADLVDINFWF